MSTALTLPEGFATGPSKKFQAIPERAGLSDGIGSSYAIVGYKGKTWSLRYRGENYNFLREDGSPAGHLDVVILRTAPMKSKSYYEGGYTPGQSDGKPPTCASLDGIIPDQGVTAPQSNACAICPRNMWKVDEKGRKGRECSDYKRLAVLIMPYQTAPILGASLMEPAFLRIPPASLNDLAMFGDTMASQGYDFSSFVTRITFDPDKPHPQFVFKPLVALKDEEAEVIIPFITDAQALRVTGEDQMATGVPRLPAPAPVAQLIAPSPQATPMPPVTPPPTPPVTPTPVQSLGLVSSKSSIPQVVAPAPVGLGLVAPAQGNPSTSPPLAEAPRVQAQPVTQTPEDTGVVQSTEDIDARVARLLNAAKAAT